MNAETVPIACAGVVVMSAEAVPVACAWACGYERRDCSCRVRGGCGYERRDCSCRVRGAMDYDKQIRCSFASVSLERMPAQSALFERSELARGADNRHSKGEQQNKQNLRS